MTKWQIARGASSKNSSTNWCRQCRLWPSTNTHNGNITHRHGINVTRRPSKFISRWRCIARCRIRFVHCVARLIDNGNESPSFSQRSAKSRPSVSRKRSAMIGSECIYSPCLPSKLIEFAGNKTSIEHRRTFYSGASAHGVAQMCWTIYAKSTAQLIAAHFLLGFDLAANSSAQKFQHNSVRIDILTQFGRSNIELRKSVHIYQCQWLLAN